MTRVFAILACAMFALSFGPAGADDKKKDEKPPVGALPPHSLDGVFVKVKTEKEITDTLINDATYKKAVAAALKAKKEKEEELKKNPKIVGPSPAAAARVAFLKVLAGEDK
ncbi:unnamed protein product [Gemmata massiliana]|uniref:Uncharacterized protein n=1 Tax=Gemmata massiliana TaxID=1210884 RepID=A0A6P2CP84_9BACT|nr:hypothetical protein [Gemmata massiliana]VTR90828.1 unnamed protein product [Gemmata massiliana]